MPLSTKIRKSTSTEATLLLLRLQLSRSIKKCPNFETLLFNLFIRIANSPSIGTADLQDATHTGRYHDNSNDRLLLGRAQLSLHSMTIEYCHSYCTDQGYTTLGVEDSNQCFSAKYVSYTPISFDGCTYACDGNKDRDM